MDANTYIQAKNQYYHMDVCPGFWDWLDKQYQAGNLASVLVVYDELKYFGDELSDWVKSRREQFLDIMDKETQEVFAEIAQYLMTKDFSPKNRDDFLAGADPWLIAKAKSMRAVVVSHESLVPEHSKKVKVPNVCKQFGVECIKTFKLLRLLEARLILDKH